MLMVIPNEGKELWLYWALGTDGTDLEDFEINLFQNNYTPDDDSTDSDFTVATFTGYAQVDADRAQFGAPAIIADVAYSTLNFVPTFICTGGAAQTVYGWWMRGRTSGIVLAAQRFDAPRVMTNGATEELDPFRIALQSIT